MSKVFDPQVIYRTATKVSDKWLTHVELGYRVHDTLRDENSNQAVPHIVHLVENAQAKA